MTRDDDAFRRDSTHFSISRARFAVERLKTASSNLDLSKGIVDGRRARVFFGAPNKSTIERELVTIVARYRMNESFVDATVVVFETSRARMRAATGDVDVEASHSSSSTTRRATGDESEHRRDG